MLATSSHSSLRAYNETFWQSVTSDFMANLKFKYPLALQKLAFEDDIDK